MTKIVVPMLVYFTLLTTTTFAQSTSESKARLSSKAVAAWECTMYAEKSEQTSEQERLFKVGYEAMQKFVSAARKKEIAEHDWRAHVPMIVGFVMAGPSYEFIVGRLFESIAQYAFKKSPKKTHPVFPFLWINTSLTNG